MRIIFLCGSIEPGRDGVGDYTRRLAGELIRQGHTIVIISLNESRLKDIFLEETQESEGTIIPVLRLSNKINYKERFAKAQERVNEFNPDWISLQYVPFSFQKKGLPVGFAGSLKLLGKGRKWYIMFHELWVGMEKAAPLKMKIWGMLQRYLIKSLVRAVKPRLVYTQTKLYQSQLMKIKIDTKILPLFGGIPVAGNALINEPADKESFAIVVFGGIHHGAPIKEFAKEIKDYSQLKLIDLKILFLGRNGPELKHWLEVCKTEGIAVDLIGEQTPGQISTVLKKSSIGISTTPFVLTEKSSVVASMNEHELPVLCVAREWTASGIGTTKMPAPVACYYPGLLLKDDNWRKKNHYDYNLSVAAARLMNDLNTNS